jgi:hypothetical protein
LSNGGQAIFNGLANAASAGANFSAGTLGGGYGYSGATPSSGGTEMTMASVPSYVVAGVLLHNTARSSYAWVDTVTTGTAKLTQPMTAASLTGTSALPAPAVDNDWVAGDTIAALQPLSVNMKWWSPYGGDLSSGGQPTGGYIIGVQIADSSGSGTALFAFHSRSAVGVVSLCYVAPRLDISVLSGRASALYILGSYAAAQVLTVSGPDVFLYGGVDKTGIATNSTVIAISGNNVVHTGLTANNSYVSLAGLFSDSGAWSIQHSQLIGSNPSGTTVSAWGSFGINLYGSSSYMFNASGSVATTGLLTNGTLEFQSTGSPVTTGCVFNSGTLVYTSCATTITPANIDSNGAIQSMFTGAFYSNGIPL